MTNPLQTAANASWNTWVLASHNQGKLREFDALLAPLSIHIKSAGELGLPEPEETGHSFEANAILKADAACLASGLPALADDSGIVVPALDGAPGIYSARWGGANKDFTFAMHRVIAELDERNIEVEGTKAFFVCVLAVARPHHPLQHFRGECHGTLTRTLRGTLGHGYDPFFIPEGFTTTFGEMGAENKNTLSHRAKAFALFEAWFKQQQMS